MTNSIINAVALTLGALEDYIKENDYIPSWTPGALSDACNKLGAGSDVIYLLTAFALSLAKGMAENPGDIPTMCGGVNIPDGGSLIVAFEALSYSLSDKHKK